MPAKPRRRRVHLVCPKPGSGLAHDHRILESALRGLGLHCPRFPHPGHGPESKRFRLARVLNPSLWFGGYDLNVFLEEIDLRWLGMARRQVLVPNQEWLRDDTRALLPRMDLVLCKTRHAESIFADLGCRTRFCGFSSPDRACLAGRVPYPAPAHYAEPRPIHVAGVSQAKGTRVLLEVWARNPRWPRLTVVARPIVTADLPAPPPNVRLVHEYLSDRALGQLMAAHNLHLCPSEAEGWGHTLVEAMSCAAVVLTTDAPPMSELIAPERGVLVPPAGSEPMRAGTRYWLEADALEAAVDALLGRSSEELRSAGHAARRWYEQNEARFADSIAALFEWPEIAG